MFIGYLIFDFIIKGYYFGDVCCCVLVKLAVVVYINGMVFLFDLIVVFYISRIVKFLLVKLYIVWIFFLLELVWELVIEISKY